MTHAFISEELAQSNTGNLDKTLAQESVRFHYMDNVRALAMLAGIFFHAALAYSPLMQNLWLAADPQNSLVLDALAWFLHLFRMPLFFLISGFFALMLIEKRGMKGFLVNRGSRIVIPFLIFLPLVLISLIMLIGWAIYNVENPSPILQFIAATYNNPDVPQPPFSTTHLWFLFNLALFCLVLVAVSKLFKSHFIESLATTRFFIGIFPLLLVPALYTQTTPHPAAERIYPELWSFGFYGIFFFAGAILFTRPALFNDLERHVKWMLLFSLAGYAIYYAFLPQELSLADIIAAQASQEHSWQHLLIVGLTEFIAVYMTLVCLLSGKKLLAKESRVFRLIADSSYWVYIIHLPLLFWIQFLLLDVEWNLWAKFLVASLSTLLIGLASYLVCVRWTPIGWLLNGRSSCKSSPKVGVNSQ
jgi:glucans biosynthesis protein C